MMSIEEALAQAELISDDENWVRIEKYPYKSFYEDEEEIFIDVEKREISDPSKNVSTLGENNSQLITFVMDRYADGVDLVDMLIQIQYKLQSGEEATAGPVNVYASDDKIKFGWAISNIQTQSVQTIQFIVYCTGKLEDGESYLLKTKPMSYRIENTLGTGGYIEKPSDEWFLQFEETMNEKMNQVATFTNSAIDSAADAKESEQNAAQSASTASILAGQVQSNTAQAKASADAAKVSEQNAKKSEDAARVYAGNASAVANVQIGTSGIAGLLRGGDIHVDESGALKMITETTETTMTNSFGGRFLFKRMNGAVEQNGVPTPDSPVEIQNVDFTEIKSNSKNLLDLSLYTDRTNQGVTATIKSQTMILNGAATNAGALPTVETKPFPFKAKVGDTLTISTTILSGSATIAENTSLSYCVIRVDKEEVTRFAVKSKSGKIDKNTKITSESIVVTEDMISDDGFIYHTTQVYIRANDVYNNLVLGIQIELNSVATEWKPYKSSTAKVAFTGRAIEVSESDAYTYEKDGKYYVADTIEKTDSGYHLVQRIGEVVFDGSSDENWYRTSTNGDIYSTKNLDQVNGIPKGLCSHFVYVGKSSTVIGSLAITEVNCRPYFFFAEYGTTTVDDWASWLNANNITYHYILEEPIITELSDADKIALNSIETYDEITYIGFDSEIKPEFEGEYGTSKVGGYTLKALLTARNNEMRITAIEAAGEEV